MKNSKTVILVIILIAVAAVAAWGLWPRTALVETKPVAAKSAAAPETPKPVAVAAVEQPKAAPAKPADAPAVASGTTAGAGRANTSLSAAERQARRDGERRAVETQMRANLAQIQVQIDSATDEQQRQMLRRMQESMQRTIQQRLDQLALPPPSPVDFGTVLLTEGTPVEQPVDDGSIATLSLRPNPNGQWQISVSVKHTDPNGGTSSYGTSMPPTSGQPMVINVNDYEIHVTPQVPNYPPVVNRPPPPSPPGGMSSIKPSP